MSEPALRTAFAPVPSRSETTEHDHARDLDPAGSLLTDHPGARRSSLEDGADPEDARDRRVVRLDDRRRRPGGAAGTGGEAARHSRSSEPSRHPAHVGAAGRPTVQERNVPAMLRRRLAAALVFWRRIVHGDDGMATAEYAIATLAAVGFAGLLVLILKGNEVKGLLTAIIRQALGG